MVLGGFEGFSQNFVGFSSNFGAMGVLSRFLEGFRVHCRVLDGFFERFWKVFIEFRCFFVQFWSYGCFESVFGRFRSVIKDSGWFSEVLEGFHRFSLFFRPILELRLF